MLLARLTRLVVRPLFPGTAEDDEDQLRLTLTVSAPSSIYAILRPFKGILKYAPGLGTRKGQVLWTRLFGRARCPGTHLYRRARCRTQGISTYLHNRARYQARCFPTSFFRRAQCPGRGNRPHLIHRPRCRVRRIGTRSYHQQCLTHPRTRLRGITQVPTGNLFCRRLDATSRR